MLERIRVIVQGGKDAMIMMKADDTLNRATYFRRWTKKQSEGVKDNKQGCLSNCRSLKKSRLSKSEGTQEDAGT